MALRIHVISGRNIKASLATLCLSLAFVCCDGVSLVHSCVHYNTQHITSFLTPPDPSWRVHYFRAVITASCPVQTLQRCRKSSYTCWRSIILIRSVSGDNTSFSAVYTVIGIAGTGCLFFAELIVQGYTWRNTWRLVRETKNIRTRKSLLFFLLRDGKLGI